VVRIVRVIITQIMTGFLIVLSYQTKQQVRNEESARSAGCRRHSCQGPIWSRANKRVSQRCANDKLRLRRVKPLTHVDKVKAIIRVYEGACWTYGSWVLMDVDVFEWRRMVQRVV
jgi:hypothetical protein